MIHGGQGLMSKLNQNEDGDHYFNRVLFSLLGNGLLLIEPGNYLKLYFFMFFFLIPQKNEMLNQNLLLKRYTESDTPAPPYIKLCILA